jgi:hypothetical protein
LLKIRKGILVWTELENHMPSIPIFHQEFKETILAPEVWDREELYLSVWQAPIGEIAPQYDLTKDMLILICTKLQVPRPPRGYWRKIDAGISVPKTPLPPLTNPPFVPRLKKLPPIQPAAPLQDERPSRTEDSLMAIRRLESAPRGVTRGDKIHELISVTTAVLRDAKPFHRDCILQGPRGHKCLDIKVTKAALKRALDITNAICLLLEEEGFTVSLDDKRTFAEIAGQKVPFCLSERLRVRSRHKMTNLNKVLFRYEPTGDLEFRAGARSFSAVRLRDGKDCRLHDVIHLCVSSLMREARRLRIAATEEAKLEVQREHERRELARLSGLLAKEEGRVRDFRNRVSNWSQAQEARKFISVFEKGRSAGSVEFSADSETGKRIAWMKEQVDRLDPFEKSPPSILDRKGELISAAKEMPWVIASEVGILRDGLSPVKSSDDQSECGAIDRHERKNSF